MTSQTNGICLDSQADPVLNNNSYMSDFTFRISKDLIRELIDYGLTSPEREVCGLVTGTKWSAEKFHAITNISSNFYGYDDYVMDPQQSMAVLSKSNIIPVGNTEYDLVAVFHTHPHGTPYPSSIDIAWAAYNVVYIIYSVTMDQLTFNYWNGTQFVPTKVEVF